MRFFTVFFLLLISLSAKSSHLDSLLLIYASSDSVSEEKAIVSNDIAAIYQILNEREKANFYFKEALHITTEILNEKEVITAQDYYDLSFLNQNLAIFNATIGENAAASKYANQAKRHLNNLKPLIPLDEFKVLQASLSGTELTIHYHNNQIDSALHAFKTMLRLMPLSERSPKGQIEIYRLKGELNISKKNYTIAESAFTQALELYKTHSSKDNYKLIYGKAASLFYQKKFNDALNFINEHQHLRSLSSEINSDDWRDCLFLKSYIHNKNSHKDPTQLDSAWLYIKKAFTYGHNKFKSIHNQSTSVGLDHPENKIYALLGVASRIIENHHNPKEIVETVFHEIDMRVSFQFHQLMMGDDTYTTNYKDYKKLDYDIDFLIAEIEKKPANTDDLKALLNKKTIERNLLKSSLIFENPKERYTALLDLVAEDQAIVTFWYSKKQSDSVFVIYGNATTQGIYAINASDLNVKLELHRNSVVHFRPIEKLNSRALYTILLAPLKEKGIKELFFLPTKNFNQFPLETLLNENDEFAIHDFNIHYLSTLTKPIISSQEKIFSEKDFSVFFPKEFPQSFSVLKQGEKEANDLKELLNPNLYKGSNASVKNFKVALADQKIIHLITHTIIKDSINPSSFILLNGQDSTARLMLGDIFNVSGKPALITLASCNTQVGKYEDGFGVQSFANAFIFSGVETVIGSLWEVQDNSSRKITLNFYKNLKNELSISESLRQAKITYLSQADKLHSHPYLWSSFVVYGEDSVIQIEPENNGVLFWVFLVLGAGLILYSIFKIKAWASS